MPFSWEQKAKAKAVRYGRDDSLEAVGDCSLCCRPGGCLREEGVLKVDDFPSTERVICSSDGCTRSGLMHKACFNDFEDQVLVYLKSTGRARSWSEKQRRQNVWNKKGYDLAYKACNCDCGKGVLRKDVDYKSPRVADPLPQDGEEKRKKKSRKASDKPSINVGKSGVAHSMSHTRTHSASSGYSTSSSLSGSMGDVSNFSSQSVSRKSSTDCYLQRRMDMAAFRNALPRHRINPYDIRMDDEETVHDDLRQLVTSGLISHRISKVPCCLCRKQMQVYDKYPIVDGVTYFTPLEPKSPQRLIPLRHESAVVYLLAVCLQCVLGRNHTTCSNCSAPWSGVNLLLGAIYSFDIFSASPCCESRTICTQCSEPAIPLTGASMLSYSQCSGVFSCENCGHEDTHLVQPLTSYDVVPAATS